MTVAGEVLWIIVWGGTLGSVLQIYLTDYDILWDSSYFTNVERNEWTGYILIVGW